MITIILLKVSAIKMRCSDLDIKIKSYQTEITNRYGDEIATLEESIRMNNLTLVSLREEESLEMKKHDIVSGEIAETRGRLGRIEEEQGETSRNICSYESAVDDFAEAFLEYEVLSMASVDIQNYHKSLDKAMMSYHSDKMKEINLFIRELWMSIYQGDDIEYVYIKTCTDDSSTSVTDTDISKYNPSESIVSDKDDMFKSTHSEGLRGKSYDYQLMMVSDNIHSSLRGRCSAGQKVLASLIVRLALAESFGSNCGIFALDEPTTNLDARHSAALADALSRLVQQGRGKSNFQLLLITHDEEFVKELCSVKRLCERYHRLSKDHQGFSTIESCDISNIA